MGFTERLARASAARPRLTLALWGVAVLIAFALIATSLHGLSSQGNVEGSPESTKAKNEIAQAFPGVVASEKPSEMIATSPSATMIDRIAISTGTSPANTAPKTSTRTISAAGRPNASSPVSRSFCDCLPKS